MRELVREVAELRRKSDQELLKEVSEIRTEIRKLRTEVRAGGRVENPMRLRNLRRRLARVLTILNERRRAASR
ncbi:MAG: 50S ribosomal protein L29 [Nitrososphaerota archaeon]